MKALFLIQMFDTKKLNDSAGLNEIAKPMIQSNYLSTYHVFSWGVGEHYINSYIEDICSSLQNELGSEPVTIYGAGAHTEGLWPQLSRFNVESIADKQLEKQGKQCCKINIISPTEITTNIIIVSSRAWEESIVEELAVLYPDKQVIGLYGGLVETIVADNNSQIKKLGEKFDKYEFDYVFYTPADPAEALTKSQLSQLKKMFSAKLVVVWWDYDDSSESNVYMTLERNSLLTADFIIDPGNISKTIKMKQGFFPYHNHSLTEKVALLPTPVDSSIFYPRDKIMDVAMFGSDVGLRRKWIDGLYDKFPENFHHIGGVGSGKVAIPMEDYGRMVGECKIIVNSQTYSFRTQCKGKVREALASGCLLLEEDCFDTRSFIGEHNFIKFYSSEEELYDLVKYYLKHDVEREKIAQQGYSWYLDNWSSTPWSKKVLSFN